MVCSRMGVGLIAKPRHLAEYICAAVVVQNTLHKFSEANYECGFLNTFGCSYTHLFTLGGILLSRITVRA